MHASILQATEDFQTFRKLAYHRDWNRSRRLQSEQINGLGTF
jgi:hypothetical protein